MYRNRREHIGNREQMSRRDVEILRKLVERIKDNVIIIDEPKSISEIEREKRVDARLDYYEKSLHGELRKRPK